MTHREKSVKERSVWIVITIELTYKTVLLIFPSPHHKSNGLPNSPWISWLCLD